jgi:hypothetical protein
VESLRLFLRQGQYLARGFTELLKSIHDGNAPLLDQTEAMVDLLKNRYKTL